MNISFLTMSRCFQLMLFKLKKARLVQCQILCQFRQIPAVNTKNSNKISRSTAQLLSMWRKVMLPFIFSEFPQSSALTSVVKRAVVNSSCSFSFLTFSSSSQFFLFFFLFFSKFPMDFQSSALTSVAKSGQLWLFFSFFLLFFFLIVALL